VIHPDGTRDEYIYYLDGTLKTHINPQGTATSYVYNGLRQITQKTISSAAGILAEEHFEYRGNNLIAQIDAEGNRTTFLYDGAGRKIAEECNGEKTTFSYDSLGRLHQVQTGDLSSITEHNLLNQVIEEKKTVSNDLIRQEQYEYDSAGNRSAVIHNISGQSARETLRYDSMNRLIQKTNSIGAIETTSYQDQYPNAYGQKVLQTIHTDPMGLETIETKDAQNHQASLEKRNGCTLSRQEKFYDANGQPTRQIDTIFMPDGSSHDVQTHWEYDHRGRLITLIEADGSPDAKTTRHLYQPDGKLSQTTKPDGTSLFYTYDGLSNLVSLQSSDGTVRHQMAYNRLGHLVQSDDSRRTYDAKGRILTEAFPNGYSMENSFDGQGRRIACSIPAANCQIDYSYHGLDPQSVQRKTINGQTLYTHHYSSYDLSGNLLEEELIDGSRVRFTIDPLSRKTMIDSPHFMQEAVQFDPVGNITRMRTQNDESVYSYDKLYQLTSESGLFAHEYVNDSLNNRLQKDQEQIQVNDLNEDVSHFEYNKNGNPIVQGDTHYTYDALDRLIRIESSQLRQELTYDSLHRCLTKTTLQDGAQETRYFLYDGQNEIGSFDEGLNIQELRILGSAPHAEIGAAIAIELQGKAYAPIHDLPGNVAVLAPLDCGSASIYRYSAFGEEKIDGSILSPWRFSSKRSDASTGLVYYGRRYYMPAFGRWLTPDPAGFTDGMNLYAFVHNDPLTHFDEYGLLTGNEMSAFHSMKYYESYSSIMAARTNQLANLYCHPRFQGGLQALGGLSEIYFGGFLTCTKFMASVGLPIMMHGMDHYYAGMDTVISGRFRETMTSQLLQKTGMSPQTAGKVDNGFSMVGTMGGMGAIRAGQVAAFPSYALPINSGISRPATSSMSAHLLRNKLIAEEISGGHAFTKHVINRNEFPGFSRCQFEQHIRSILNNPTEMKILTNGRTGYWNQESGTVIIRDPFKGDGGTAFRPDLGKKYYDEWLK
jgi:RHS repeat-associated protein